MGFAMVTLDAPVTKTSSSILAFQKDEAVSNKLLSALMPGRFLANGLSIIIAMLVYAVAVIRVGTLSESDMLALPMGGRILRVCKRFKIFPQERDLDDDDDIEYLD